MTQPSTEQQGILSLVQRGLRDVANGDLVDDSEVWADIDDLLNRAGAHPPDLAKSTPGNGS
jgi:hypothetical protein